MRESNEKKKKSYLSLNLNLLCIRIMCPIHYFHIDHNAPRFINPTHPPPTLTPPEFCITIGFPAYISLQRSPMFV